MLLNNLFLCVSCKGERKGTNKYYPPDFDPAKVNTRKNTISKSFFYKCISVLVYSCILICLPFLDFSMDRSMATIKLTLCGRGPGNCPRASSSSGLYIRLRRKQIEGCWKMKMAFFFKSCINFKSFHICSVEVSLSKHHLCSDT